MSKRKQIGIKLPPELIDAIDSWCSDQELPPTRTQVIEAAVQAWLHDRTARDAGRSKKAKAS